MKVTQKVRLITLAIAAIALLLLGSVSFAQEKIGKIQATAHGEGDQAGMSIGLTLTIESYSTAEDRKALWEGFDKGGEQGLAKAIVALPPRGHLSFSGVAEYEVAYIRVFPTAAGRMMRLVARRKLAFGETKRYENVDYLLAAVEFEFPAGGAKSSGGFIPACSLSIKQDQEIDILTYQSAWGLDDITIETR